MRGYAKVYSRFWMSGTGRKLRQEGRLAQLVAVYLITGPQANMLGLYYLPKSLIAHEIGMDAQETEEALQACERAGFSKYDDATETIWVFEMARFQIEEKLVATDKRSKGVQAEYDYQPDNPHLPAFFDKYAEAFCMSKCRGRPDNEVQNTVAQALLSTKPLRCQKQKQKQKKKQKENLANTSVLAVSSVAGDVSSGGGKQVPASGGAAASGTADPSFSDSAQSTAKDKDPLRAEFAATACPHQEIIALYHQVLPQCPKVRDWTHGRAVQLRARWNEDRTRQSMDYWRLFFEYVAGSHFLTGRAQHPGSRPFMADLAWMTKAVNFAKIREGHYDNR
ncbi:hypothetical protein [Undibacterium sp.]|uniref:hypothetical protein n=1 Tax=Undibacterium sp. TaxID=1914977 RepID=UPI00374DB3E4